MWRWFLAIALTSSTIGLLSLDTQGRTSHRGGGSPTIFPLNSLTFGSFSVYGVGQCGSGKCLSGDTYWNTWADNGTIYLNCNDCKGFGGSFSGNTIFNSVDGYSPSMTGTTINAMSDFGTENQQGSDFHSYKSTGLISVNGTLIQAMTRQACDSGPNFGNTQLIKSTNHGTTWAPLPPSPGQPYVSPMFTDPKFENLSFFQYGQDYIGQSIDRSNEFVYALSVDQTAGHQSNCEADRMFLGRVPVGSIANLNVADWQYYQGGDGSLDINWGPTSTAVAPLNTPGTYTFLYNEAQYLPAFGKYLFFSDYNPTPGDITSVTWQAWIGDHPWGPWVLLQSNTWNTGNPQAGAYGFYFPATVVKSISTDGGRNFTLLTTAVFNISGFYTMFIVPVAVN